MSKRELKRELTPCPFPEEGCKACNEEGCCIALLEPVLCKDGKCKFYKSQDEAQKVEIEIKRRLEGLGIYKICKEKYEKWAEKEHTTRK